jgi:O-antigen ligase
MSANKQKSRPAEKQKASQPANPQLLNIVFALCFGGLLGIALLKLGNPVILDHLLQRSSESLLGLEPNLASSTFQTNLSAESSWFDNLFVPWPMSNGLWWLAIVAILGLLVGTRKHDTPKYLLLLPLYWFGWQLLATVTSVSFDLSRITLTHFTACLACFYLGWFALARNPARRWFFLPIIVGFLLMLWYGFGQHYGGLEATRKWVYEQPSWQLLPQEFLTRISTGRIYSTLVYPNALAGIILLLLPPLLMAAWQLTRSLGHVVRGVTTGLIAYAGIACLIWSGSKSAWLIALLCTVGIILNLNITKKLRWGIILLVLAAGLVGFGVRYSSYFKKGATSVSARYDYWRAAAKIAIQHPITGSGPGTFAIPYSGMKAPEAEMARLVHNDYLEQASDSGIPGFIFYICFIFGILFYLYRYLFQYSKVPKERAMEWSKAATLGLVAWSLHEFVEFGLYIPALSWTAFTLMGWLIGTVEVPAKAPQTLAPSKKLTGT